MDLSIKKLAFASDHAGYGLKSDLMAYAQDMDVDIVDLGCTSEDSVDYPDYGHKLATYVTENTDCFGVAICGSGIGISIAANRHAHIRAALCHNDILAKLARQHNNANILAMGARFIDVKTAQDMLDMFLSTEFEAGRHETRMRKIEQ